jgi:hypothetical protein
VKKYTFISIKKAEPRSKQNNDKIIVRKTVSVYEVELSIYTLYVSIVLKGIHSTEIKIAMIS